MSIRDQEVKAAVDDLGRAFDDFKVANDAKIAAAVRRSDDLELALNRKGLGGSGPGNGGDEAKHAAQFYSTVRGLPVAPHEADVEGYRSYKAALTSYLRRGRDGVGPDVHAALSVGSDPSGGYLVSPDTSGRMIEKIFEVSPIRQIASVAQTGSTDALEGIADINEPGTGGWVAEEGARGETASPEIQKYRIPLHEQFAMPRVTQKLLDDTGFDVDAWLVNKLRRKLGRDENAAFVSGNGVGQPEGLLLYPTSTDDDDTRPWGTLRYIPTGAAGAFAATDPADALYDTLFSLKAEYLANARWLMARSTMNAASKLKDGQGNYLLARGDIAGQQRLLLLGHEVVLAEDMPAIAADSFSIAFGDFESGYQIVDHARGFTVLRDPYTTKGSVKFYVTRRVGGAVVDFDAIKLVKFAAS